MTKEETLLRQLSTINWTEVPTNQTPAYLSKMVNANRISAMPPSPAVEQMELMCKIGTTTEGKPELIGKVRMIPSTFGKRLMKELPPSQLTHRSRVVAVSSPVLQAEELSRRIKLTQDGAAVSRLGPYLMSTTQSSDTFDIVLAALKQHFRFDPKHIAKYVNEHKASAVSPGIKWADLPDVLTPEGEAWWRKAYQYVTYIWTELIPEKKGQFITKPYNVGIRARNEATVRRGIFEYDFEDIRSRIVLYMAPMSMPLCFVPEKTSLYSMIKDRISRYLNLPDFDFPPVDGGVIYKNWSDKDQVICNLGDDWNEKNGDEQLSWDGKNWEQWVGAILGPSWSTVMVVLDDTIALPSGTWLTTIAGSIAMWHLATLARREGVTEIPSVWERQKEDEEVKFLLGLQYGIDQDFPRLQGLKLSVDDARKMRKVEPMKVLTLTNNYKEQQSVSWYNAYHGLTLDGESLLKTFEEVTPEEYVSPSALVKRLILDK